MRVALIVFLMVVKVLAEGGRSNKVGDGPKAADSAHSVQSGGATTFEKPLKVIGQTRTLSMMLVLKNKKERIHFTGTRENYREEILGTQY